MKFLTEKVLALIICTLSSLWVLFNFSFYLEGEISHHSDFALHLSVLLEFDRNFKSRGNPLDFWYDSTPFGIPFLRTYQSVPYVIIYSIYRVFFEIVTLEALLRWTTVLLSCALPWAVLIGLRTFGFPWVVSGIVGILSLTIAEASDYGMGLQNYTWGTGGIINQLWATVFFFPAFSFSVKYLMNGKKLGWALFFLFLTSGSHLVCFVGISIALLIFSICSFSFKNINRYFILGSLFLFVTAYQWIFLIKDSPYLHKSIHEPRWKFDGFGFEWVINNFISGDLFDLNRFPSLTIFLIFGITAVLTGIFYRSRSVQFGILLNFTFWVIFFIGKELWGGIVGHLSILDSFHTHRLIVLVHIFGLFLIGYGIQVLLKLPKVGVVLVLLMVIPVEKERRERFNLARSWYNESKESQLKDHDLWALINELKTLPRSYIHVGMMKNWAEKLKIGNYLPIGNVLMEEGLKTFYMLYHAYALSGDSIFSFDPDREEHYQLFDVRYTVAPASWNSPAFLRFINANGRYYLYEYLGAKILDGANIDFSVPKFNSQELIARYMVRWVESERSKTNSLGLINSENVALPVLSADQLNLDFSEKPKVEITSLNSEIPGLISASIKCNGTRDLLIKTTYHPNWKATFNGEKTEVFWVTPGFMAVKCQDGDFEMRYRGSKSKLFLFIFSILLVSLIIPYVERKKIY